MTKGEILAQGVETTKALTLRFLEGLDERAGVTQPPHLPNHAVWILGHLAITMHRCAEHIDAKPVPESDFLVGGSLDGGGDAKRFATESVAFKSRPSGNAAMYPALPRARVIFEHAVDCLASALRAASDATLDKQIPWGAATTSLDQLAFRMIFHNGMHAGQLTDLRRAMGLKGVIS